jgi:hypothetical protein
MLLNRVARVVGIKLVCPDRQAPRFFEATHTA